MTDTNDLLDAVDALTKPYRHGVLDIHGKPQHDDSGDAVTVKRAPRLDQLHDAIYPTGTAGANSPAARERSVIDASALEQWSQYRDQINEAARKVDVKIDPDPAVTLRRWYVAVAGRTLTDAFEAEWGRRFTDWARAIDRRLSPPFQLEIVRPCPFCGESRAIDKQSKTEGTAVVAECWRDDSGIDTTWFIRCRFCGAVGYSLQEVREWAYHLEQAEQASA